MIVFLGTSQGGWSAVKPTILDLGDSGGFYVFDPFARTCYTHFIDANATPAGNDADKGRK